MSKAPHVMHGRNSRECKKLTGPGPCDGHCNCWCKQDGNHCQMCFDPIEVCDKRAEETGDDECEWLAAT